MMLVYLYVFVYKSCSHVFHIIRPSRAPAFFFLWLELISHRTLLGKLLMPGAQQKVHLCKQIE